jgi:flagellar hook-associated protein 3 FlgL
MITRVTNLMASQQVLTNINASEDSLNETEEELSTGKRINQPSDDPYGASLAVSLNGQLSRLNDYTDNISDGTSWTTAGLNAMQSISDQVQRAQELVTEASNGTESSSELQAAGAEIDQLIQGVKSDANSTFDGQYVFGGGSTTAPYSSADNSFHGTVGGQVQRTVSAGSADTANVTVNSQLYTVLNGSANDNTGLLSQLQSIADSLNAGNPPPSGALTQLSGSLDGLEQQSASLGAAQDRLSLASTRIQSLQTSVTSSLSDDEDANMAQTLTTFSNQQAAFTAALKAGANIVQSSLMDFLDN